jgi:AraC-like DNA-binding protein
MLTPTERQSVDAAGVGAYRPLHRDSLDEVVQDVRSRRASAVLLSVTRYDARLRAGVAAMVREFPQVPTVALLSHLDRTTPQAMIALGSTGLSRLVDVREPAGWTQLREYLYGAQKHDIQRMVMSQLAVDLAGAPPDLLRFFEALVSASAHGATIATLARQLHVVASTLVSRFFRAGVPAPKQYLTFARFIRAARLFENPGLSVTTVSNVLEYSSPQSFGRHLKLHMGLTACAFRELYDGERMLEHFRNVLILPYLDGLRFLRPLNPSLGATFAKTLIH